MVKRLLCAATLASCAAIFGGCATTTVPVSFMYSPTQNVRLASGDLFLKASSAAASDSGSLRYVFGEHRKSDGAVISDIVSRYSPEDLLLDALNRELTVAGYAVNSGSIIPKDVRKGVSVRSVQVAVDEVGMVPKTDVTGSINVAIDVWRDGARLKTLKYDFKASDVAVMDRDRAASDMVERGLHAIMAQALPDIVKALERQSAN